VLIAGGGTGGHLFPGIALAEEVSTRHHKNSVVFVGTDRGLEARVVPAAGYTLEIIPARGLKGMGLLRLLQGMLTLPVALFASWRILRRHRPDVVVGVGGYASFPVVFCAWLQRVPTCVQEQNALPGLTNRILGKFVKVVFISFEEARRHFPARKVNLIGNPIRAKLTDNFLRSKAAHAKFTVLVFGGSLGAKRVNALVLEALNQLSDLKEGMRFIHQTGKADLESVRQGYAARGFDAEVLEFIDDMSAAYAGSDLVVCRAGATTIAELTVCKKAAILIPYPYATDNHQEVNARSLVDAGAALMFREAELTGQFLGSTIRALKESPDRLKRMEKQAGLLGRPEAAKELADVCVDLMVRTWGPHGRSRPDKDKKKGKEAA
jgi:UDP-N-acetylglucosamine--N-acetylmuramyl-(pentapeptide) pyrophosphoryl-undecaprenol N-acetylglucosamine transferase